jgi:drug/metabolite transporter (DMT)-like permease
MNTYTWIAFTQYQNYLAFSNLGSQDLASLIHPVIVVAFIFPMIGIVSNFAWQTRQRRLESKQGKSKIPATVGRNHVKIGKWLSTSVVVSSLIAIAYSIVYKSFIEKNLWEKNNSQAILIILLFVATLISLVLLLKARPPLWRGVFATLTGMGLIILGQQDGVWRLEKEWYWSHYYFGITVSLLMLFSIAIVDDIYRDRTNTWRNIHIGLNCFALLLFFGQGLTGTRDLLEIPPVGKQKPQKKAVMEQVSSVQTAQLSDVYYAPNLKE